MAMSAGGSNRSLAILQVARFMGAQRIFAKAFDLQALVDAVSAGLVGDNNRGEKLLIKRRHFPRIRDGLVAVS